MTTAASTNPLTIRTPKSSVRLSLPQVLPDGLRQADLVPPAAPEHVRLGGRMMDSHGRTIRDMRLSITDRCNFRCVYCMEPDVRFARKESLLSVREIVRIAQVANRLGVRKIRLTGGEPTLHPQLTSIIAGIRAATDVEIAIITNGSLVRRDLLREWKSAGLKRVTISIDSLRHERFAALTRSACSPEDVLKAIEMCKSELLTPVKLNAVLIRGWNDDEAADLAELARRFDVHMRFIEYMPLDSGKAWDSSKWVSAAQTQAAIEERFALIPCNDDEPSSTSRNYRFADGAPGRVGFIAPVSSPFCGACNRLRITADGKVRPCLFSTTEWDLYSVLRSGNREPSSERIAEFLIDATWTKQAGHGIMSPDFARPDRPMSAIGG